MSQFTASEKDEFILQAVAGAEERGDSLERAGTDAYQKLEWTLEQYAAGLRRLEDRSMLEVEFVDAGRKIGFARPRRVTDFGWMRVDVIRGQSDPT